MTHEYLSGNALNKYPFDDNCNLKSSGGYVLPNDVFLDIMFFAKLDVAYKTSLIGFENDIVNSEIKLTFYTQDIPGGFTTTNEVNIEHGDIVESETIVFENSDLIVKIIPGAGMLAIVAAGAAVDHLFAATDARLASVAAIQPSPRVSSIKLYNNGTLFKTITEDDVTDVVFELEEGTNTQFGLEIDRATISVLPGVGAGLYDPCGDELVITNINSVGPDGFGNFLFFTDGCYTSEKGFNDGVEFIENYGLTITNICTPKCTSEQFGSFAHYLNRVKDGMDTIAAVATDLANELKDQIADYIAAAATTKNKPYFKTSVTKFPTYHAGVFYFSVTVGLFNKTEEDIPITVSATTSGTVVTETIRFKTGETSIVLGSLSHTGTVPCIGVGRFEFVVYGAVGTTLAITGTLDGVAFSDNLTLS